MRALLERETAGLEVSINYDELTESVLLICARGGDDGDVAVATIPPEKARDAFEHPAVYLPPDRVSILDAR